MCGRYCLDTPRADLQQALNSWLRPDDSAWLEHYAPRELIRPHEPVLAVRREHGGDHGQKHFFNVPLSQARKDLESLSRTKRKMYRKRYQFLDSLPEILN